MNLEADHGTTSKSEGGLFSPCYPHRQDDSDSGSPLGNDGYAFWFKLLELLGDSNDFPYNCNSSADWEYLLSRVRVTEPIATAILDKLTEIEAIDAKLWAEKIVWSDHFVGNLEPVFERRKSEAPQKLGLWLQKPKQK